MYLKDDTLNYSGYKFVKIPEMQSARRMTAFTTSEATTHQNPLDIIDDLKNRIRKERLLD